MRRVAVPDIFLRWGDFIVIIEAKFFTEPTVDELVEQIRLQKQAVEHVLPYTKYSFIDLREKVPKLIRNGSVYVGITGGVSELQKMSMKQLEKRSHYKVSDTRWSDNWITIDQLLHRYIELQGDCEIP